MTAASRGGMLTVTLRSATDTGFASHTSTADPNVGACPDNETVTFASPLVGFVIHR